MLGGRDAWGVILRWGRKGEEGEVMEVVVVVAVRVLLISQQAEESHVFSPEHPFTKANQLLVMVR